MNTLYRLFFIAIAGTIVVVSSAHAQIPLSPYTSPQGNFNAGLPGTPTPDVSYMPDVFGTTARLLVIRGTSGNTVGCVGYADSPDSITEMKATGILVSIRNMIARSCNAEPDGEVDLTMGINTPYKGLEFNVAIKAKKGKRGKAGSYDIPGIGTFKSGMGRFRIYAGGTRIYIVGICMSAFNGDDADSFFDKFELINK